MKAVNLIPSEHRATAKPAAGAAGPSGDGSAFGAYVILGALVFAIGAMALYVMTSNSIKENKAELQRVEQEASTIEAQASSMQSFADFKQLADARADTVRGIATSRFAWNRTMADVSRALPDDVFISSLDGSTVSSTAGSSTISTSIQAPKIELNGCTRSQDSVARLMSSLRGVRGVTRVSLSKSEAVDTVDTAAAPAPATSVDGSTPATTTEPCPKGAPPAFNMTIFFERAPVSAAAAPNAGTAAVSGPTGAAGAAGPTGSSGATTPASATTTTP